MLRRSAILCSAQPMPPAKPGRLRKMHAPLVAASAQGRLVLEVVLLEIALLAESLRHQLPVLRREMSHCGVQLGAIVVVRQERAVRAASVVRPAGDDALARGRAEHAGPAGEQPRQVGGDDVLAVVRVDELHPFAREIEGHFGGRDLLVCGTGHTCCHRTRR